MNMRSIRKNYLKICSIAFIALFSVVPIRASAQTFGELLVSVQGIIDDLLPILASLVLIGFFYGLTKYVFSAGSEEGREKGKQYIIAGIVALFLMAAIGGIINFLVEATGTGGGGIPVPDIDVDN